MAWKIETILVEIFYCRWGGGEKLDAVLAFFV
jgi:hypothetical protein